LTVRIPTTTARARLSPPTAVLPHPFAHQLLERNLQHFFPDAALSALDQAPLHAAPDMSLVSGDDLAFNWFGTRYGLVRQPPLSVLERLLVDTIADVLKAPAFNGGRGDARGRARLEDRCVAAFVASGLAYDADTDSDDHVDTLTAAIDVVRRLAAIRHRNHRATTAVLISVPDADRESLMSVGDADEPDEPPASAPPLPYPVASRYIAHAAATIDGRQSCVTLNPHGVIHVFAHGVQVFSFSDGRWRLRGTGDKAVAWEREVGNRTLADRVLRAALDASEERRGGVRFVLHGGAVAIEHARATPSGKTPSSGPALDVSDRGEIAMYAGGRCVWTL
jgi:hypothetical protein